MQDDTYNGMFIPKGTMVFANAWYVTLRTYERDPDPDCHANRGPLNMCACRSMAMDTRVYHDPELFKPERFLPGPHGPPEEFPHASFGFGRRYVYGHMRRNVGQLIVRHVQQHLSWPVPRYGECLDGDRFALGHNGHPQGKGTRRNRNHAQGRVHLWALQLPETLPCRHSAPLRRGTPPHPELCLNEFDTT